MRNSIGLVGAVGLVGWLASAHAQAPAPAAASAAFDGTYRVVSSANVNQTFTDKNGRSGPCPNRKPGPIHIANGLARYTTSTGYKIRGTVSPQGELSMQVLAPGGSRPLSMTVSGNIDNTGTVRVRQTSNACSYDFVWQKAS